MNRQTRFLLSLLLGLTALAGALMLAGEVGPGVAHAQGPDGHATYYVAPGGDCNGATPCYSSVQDAVDAVDDPGDVVKVATGIYTGVQVRAGIPQVVYITKTVTVRGGYTTADWTNADPLVNPTTLDAGGLGRVLVISGTPSAGSGQAITPTMEGLRLTGGDATGLGGGPLGYDAGGGVYVYTATATISGCAVYSNTGSTATSSYGGGVYLQNSAAMLEGNTVQGNTASTASVGYGGGLSLVDSDASLQGNTVVSNIASTALYGWGGGLYLWYSDATLESNTVQGNTASTAAGGSGGGLYLAGRAPTLQGNTVVSNTASTDDWGHGGGLSLVHSTATLQGNTVQGNTASAVREGYGGGLSLDGSAATLQGNTVVSNTASTAFYGWGGGVYLDSSAATLQDNIAQGNTASTANEGYGGGLCLAGSAATLDGNTVVSNMATLSPTATGRGGGLYVQESRPFTLTNNLVAGNHANTEGSGLWCEGSSANPTSGRLRHTTIVGNGSTGLAAGHGSGQGVYVGEYATLAFTNTILAGYSSVGITVTAGSTATLEATLWYGNGTNTGGGTILTGTVNVYDHPAFVDPAAWDYHLGDGSAAIDAGVDAGVTSDIDGDRRLWPYDIGADEVVKRLYLPLVMRRG